MLYDVFLHELGHLQIVDERASSPRRKYADETKAQDFAEHWCEELWTKPIDNADLVHNSPSEEESRRVRVCWK